MLTVEKFAVKGFDYLYLKNVEDCLIWTNFKGDPDKNFGKRGFSIDISKYPEVMEFFRQEGCNVRCWDNGKNDPVYTVAVNVDIDNDRFPCDFYNRRDDGKLIPMSRREINELDSQDFTYVDMKVREYHYTKGNGGVSLYLSKGSFAASVDPYDADHGDVLDMNPPMDDEEEEVPFD